MGLLALRPGDSLAILVDGFVNGLQNVQFPSFLPFKLRGLDSYPGGTLTHCSCQPSLDAHLSVLNTCREEAPAQPKGHVDQPDESGHFDQWPDYSYERLP